MVMEIATTNRLRLPLAMLFIKVANRLRLPTLLASKLLRLPYTYIDNVNVNNGGLRLPNSEIEEFGNVNTAGGKQ